MSKNNSMPTIWRVPHRIKGLLKRDSFDPTSPPPPIQYKKTPFICRIFQHNKHVNNKLKKKNQQWKNNDTHFVSSSELLDFTEVPLRANMMSIFHPNQQQHGWSNMLYTNSIEKLDIVSRIYLCTMSKIRLLNQYNLEQQVAIHNMLNYIQKEGIMKQRNFNSILSNRVSDVILMNSNNRKQRRTRYIFMLLSTPVSQVTDKVHPVTESISKLRRPYKETVSVTNSIVQEEEPVIKFNTHHGGNSPLSHVVAYKFVPADYLLDPATLRGPDEPQHQVIIENRLGTKYSSSTNQKEQQQQQQQSSQMDTSVITPIMARIQIQTN